MANIPLVLKQQPANFYNQNSSAQHSFDNLHPHQHHLQHDALDMLANGEPQALRLTAQQIAYLAQSTVIHRQNFEIQLDVARFDTDDITVKLLDKNIVINGKYDDERVDQHGHVTRHYSIPLEFDADEIDSKLIRDGMLEVMLPQSLNDNGTVRLVKIRRVGAPSLLIVPKHEADRKTIN